MNPSASNSKVDSDWSDHSDPEMPIQNTTLSCHLKDNDATWPKPYQDLVQSFNDTHIHGKHNPNKKINDKGDFHNTTYKTLSKYERIPGTKPGQIMVVTSEPILYEGTGVENEGEKGRSYFALTGIKNGSDFSPHHLDRKLEPIGQWFFNFETFDR